MIKIIKLCLWSYGFYLLLGLNSCNFPGNDHTRILFEIPGPPLSSTELDVLSNELLRRVDLMGFRLNKVDISPKAGGLQLILPGLISEDDIRNIFVQKGELVFAYTHPFSEAQAIITAIDKWQADNGVSEGELLSDWLGLQTVHAETSPNIGLVWPMNQERVDSILAWAEKNNFIPENMGFLWSQPDPTEAFISLYSIRKAPNGQWDGIYRNEALKVRMAKDQFEMSVLNITMPGSMAASWAEMTTAAVGQPIAIIVDEIVYSAPIVNEPIVGGKTQISGGDFDPEAFSALEIILSAPPLSHSLLIAEYDYHQNRKPRE